MKVSIVIPLYNEQDSLPHLGVKLRALLEVMKKDYEVEWVFVEDGSKDLTFELLTSLCADLPDARVLRHEKNKGFGQALRTGLGSTSGDLVVTIDGDTNYDQLEIPIILSHMTDDVDIVTASPWHQDGGRQNFPLHRFVYSRVLSWMYRSLLRDDAPNVHTFTSGFRVYRRRVIDSVVFEADDFIATAEILIRSIRSGFRVAEYTTVVFERKFGHSKLKTTKTILGHLSLLFRLATNRDFHRSVQPKGDD